MKHDKSTFELILAAEYRLSLPVLFYPKVLKNSNDWVFVLTLNAIFESISLKVAKHLFQVSRRFQNNAIPLVQKYDNINSNLNWDNNYSLRLDLFNKTNIFDNKVFCFLNSLNQLRNELVHKIQNVDFSFREQGSTVDRNVINASREAALALGWLSVDKKMFFNILGRVLGQYLPDPTFMMDFSTNPEFQEQHLLNKSPRAAFWFAGATAIESLSQLLNSKDIGGQLFFDNSLDPNLQDMLLDPKVLRFKRLILGDNPHFAAEEQNEAVCIVLSVYELINDL